MIQGFCPTRNEKVLYYIYSTSERNWIIHCLITFLERAFFLLVMRSMSSNRMTNISTAFPESSNCRGPSIRICLRNIVVSIKQRENSIYIIILYMFFRLRLYGTLKHFSLIYVYLQKLYCFYVFIYFIFLKTKFQTLFRNSQRNSSEDNVVHRLVSLLIRSYVDSTEKEKRK